MGSQGTDEEEDGSPPQNSHEEDDVDASGADEASDTDEEEDLGGFPGWWNSAFAFLASWLGQMATWKMCLLIFEDFEKLKICI